MLLLTCGGERMAGDGQLVAVLLPIEFIPRRVG